MSVAFHHVIVRIIKRILKCVYNMLCDKKTLFVTSQPKDKKQITDMFGTNVECILDALKI